MARSPALRTMEVPTCQVGISAASPEGSALLAKPEVLRAVLAAYSPGAPAGGPSSTLVCLVCKKDGKTGAAVQHMYRQCPLLLNKNPEVAFVGYSVPHPSEPKMNLRLQTVGPPATTVLHNALGTVYEIGGHVLSTFDKAVAEFKEKEQQKR